MMLIKNFRKLCYTLSILVSVLLLSGCSKEKTLEQQLNPKQPVQITIWHYYNGPQKAAFDTLIADFNETVGLEKGIIVEAHNYGDIGQLETSVMKSVNKTVGSEKLPNIFASYADTAYAVEKLGLLVNLEQYMTKEEQEQYISSYLDEGKIGSNEELEIFPTAKTTEVFMINKTDWDKFANETGASLDSLKTKEGIVTTAESYYNWTDSLTPDTPNDGKAFYGRDAVANLFIIGSRQLGCEIFKVEKGVVTLDLNKDVMRKIWDVYYTPLIKGYFCSYGRFRSDDAKIGKIISLVGSTSSSFYFPTKVTVDDNTYPIETLVLPVPVFQNGENYAVQQGAGMVVTKGEPIEEYASVVFLKWFTDIDRNIAFSCSSGYLPVKKEANDFKLLEKNLDENSILSPNLKDVLRIGFDTITTNMMYTNKAFDNGSAARKILEYHLADKADNDLEQITIMIEQGMEREKAIAVYDNDENFDKWYMEFKQKLESQIYQSEEK